VEKFTTRAGNQICSELSMAEKNEVLAFQGEVIGAVIHFPTLGDIVLCAAGSLRGGPSISYGGLETPKGFQSKNTVYFLYGL